MPKKYTCFYSTFPVLLSNARHTFAVHFLENGGDLYDLQNILGHKSIRLTERYLHYSKKMLERSRGVVDHHGQAPKLVVVENK